LISIALVWRFSDRDKTRGEGKKEISAFSSEAPTVSRLEKRYNKITAGKEILFSTLQRIMDTHFRVNCGAPVRKNCDEGVVLKRVLK